MSSPLLQANPPFKMVACPRLERRNESMVVATQRLARGDSILKRVWMERTTFMVTNEHEAREAVAGTTAAPPTSSFSPVDSAALGGGSAVAPVFAQFDTPAHLQMTCSLIAKYAHVAEQWVRNDCLLHRATTPAGIANMTPDRHRAAIAWLRRQGVPTTALMFWAVRSHFTTLYNMVVYNATTLEFPLSATVVGLVFCPVLAAFNHDCVPNVYVERLPLGYRVTAATDIAEGEELCFSYVNSAVGLETLEHIDHVLHTRHGFHCACPTHTGERPIFQGGSGVRPLSLVLYRHRAFAAQFKVLSALVDNEEWAGVRTHCEMLWKRHGDLIRAEPAAAFAVSTRFVQCIPYTPPTDNGLQWTALLESTLERYCANPLYTVRGYFYTLVETMHRGGIVKLDNVMWLRPHSDEDVVTFLNRWMEIRRYLRAVYGSSVDTINMEGHLFKGLFNYFQIMEDTVAQMENGHITPISSAASGAETTEAPLVPPCKKSVNVTANPLAIELGVRYVKKEEEEEAEGQEQSHRATMDQEELDELFRDESNPSRLASCRNIPHVKSSRRIRDKQQRRLLQKQKQQKRKTAAKTPPSSSVAAVKEEEEENEEELFIPMQFDDDEDEELFIPIQFDYDDEAFMPPMSVENGPAAIMV